ncbi:MULTISPECIES: hypothetical protein [Archaeoglobus]|jgi:hypothetical protein|uniref:Uncharacterized protein AF_2166 n=3 Tax=Archaeoglobus fulgidus TaxID=2234 RepID=Y2166_ARCFU|nr:MULTISPECIES: hypothetical protein [Archaeoglobus]O28116.1 RecName: Full=Uncharacterized protein AF_2166 [Archaeoglobus fulgidus DSM 4304]AAB89089.1 conserved hypothetical protein [Archaeoglobus fulgidus DSM 4304]AIG99154.1 hypothetical protein AFULGI_00024370 [Archaeoglobus fulgidus DSM 8774]KUJ92956.1 MAG: hypothetical protein XD40_1827 [Archaeoglobus fulgidus]KUK06457.1 MAG: Uncharacterized protein XD48_1330 [Archaeoglobus fulgidus]MDI3498196.1 hypothetical protein [Archaeoglobus sp.]
MLFIFYIPYYPGLGDFSFIINSYATNAIFLAAYALITKSKVDKIKFPIVTMLLVPLDFAAMLAGGLVSWGIVSMPYWLWGDWRLMDELARYRGELGALDAIVGGIILGYSASFAFTKVNRKHLVISWMLANSISTLVVAIFFVPHFCGMPPYRC